MPSDYASDDRPPEYQPIAESARHESSRPGSSTAPPTSNEVAEPPPPMYSEVYGEVEVQDTKARVTEDGRVNININQQSATLSTLLAPALRSQWNAIADQRPGDLPPVPPGAIPEFAVDVPSMNIVIQIIGSRGDVQPFVALGQVLKQKYGHRVRVATHPTFKGFVEENGLEFFSIGGDPSELIAFMVKNPGLMPSKESLRAGDVGKRRKAMWEMLLGAWRSCIEAGDGTSYSVASDSKNKPFVADAIIANPPSFGHIHYAEKLGIPLHLMFTMPWSPTQAFPHPLANIQYSNVEGNVTNFLSYALVEMMTWQGLGDLVNQLRERTLALETLSTVWAPGMMSRLKVPYTYCWSPALIPKPRDWPSQIDIAGFYFLSLASSYTPPPELQHFLDSGPPPVYIGFGSIVVDSPNELTEKILQAARLSGARCLVSKGWGGIGGEELDIPEGVMLLGNCPHDWLFPRCAAVVHHGGAGTTAAGISAGKPTVIVPFFGDQPFWGAMVARAGAGPDPIPHARLTAENLAEAIKHALSPEVKSRASELGESIREEDGIAEGAKSFHRALAKDPVGISRCDIFKDRVAVWKTKAPGGNYVRLSALAASILVHKGVINQGKLKLYRHKEWPTEEGPWEPITGATSALVGSAVSIMMGVGDIPEAPLKAFRSLTKKDPETDAEPPAEATYAKSKGQQIYDEEKAAQSMESLKTGSSVTVASAPVAGSSGTSTPTGEPAAMASTTSLPSTRGPATDSSKIVHDKDKWSNLDTLNSAMMGTRRVVGASLKTPMDVTLGLTRGFRNAPRLYNDPTYRPEEKITGFSSGLKVAGKEFVLGVGEGIGGLVYQPFLGAKSGGVAGALKGFGRGIGGVVLRPTAGAIGIAGYTMKGVHQAWRNMNSPDVNGYVQEARLAQGKMERMESSMSKQREAVKTWYAFVEAKKWKKGKGKATAEELDDVYHRTSTPSPPSTPGLVENDGRQTSGVHDMHEIAMNAPDSELEAAIRQSIAQTSTGNEDEDEAVERALRASLAELQRNPTGDEYYDEEEALQRAMRASAAAYAAGSGVPQQLPPFKGEKAMAKGKSQEDPEFEKNLAEAFALSMGLSNVSPAELETPLERSPLAPLVPGVAPPIPPRSPGRLRTFSSDNEDEELQRAIRESAAAPVRPATEDEEALERVLRESAAERARASPPEDEEALERALRESVAERMSSSSPPEDEEHLKRAIRASLLYHNPNDSGTLLPSFNTEPEPAPALPAIPLPTRSTPPPLAPNPDSLPVHARGDYLPAPYLLQRSRTPTLIRTPPTGSSDNGSVAWDTADESSDDEDWDAVREEVEQEEGETPHAVERVEPEYVAPPPPPPPQLPSELLGEHDEQDAAVVQVHEVGQETVPEQREAAQGPGANNEEDELQRVLRESLALQEEEERNRKEEEEKRRQEEEIVMNYVMRQSREEEELRKRLAGGS